LNGQHDATSVTRVSHRFLDEAGDTTFYGKGRIPIVGRPGVSLSFAIGMVKFNADLNEIRKAVRALQDEATADKYLLGIASVAKKAAAGGFYFHATDDPPEVRERFFKFIESLDCTCEVMVARKLPSMFALKHHHQEAEFYADVLSHLLKNKLKLGQKVVLNIAERGASTRNVNLQLALTKAVERFEKKGSVDEISSLVVFNVQNHRTEPLLNIADYLCWSVQRVFERGETRYYDFLGDKIRLVVDLYDTTKYKDSLNYYRGKRRLTAENKISPPSP
jgi:Protein of unknown function (DUF3800)